MTNEVHVNIGQVKLAKNGETLRALLGSCVGIGILWKKKNLYGLAHCLLPKAPSQTFEIGGRFVDQAVASLLAMMKIKPEHYEEIEVIIAGGGNMTCPDARESGGLVGETNFRTALEEIRKRGLNLVFKDGGGIEGRKIIIESSTGRYRVEKIPRITEVA